MVRLNETSWFEELNQDGSHRKKVEARWRRLSRQPKSRAQPGPPAQAGFAWAGVEKRGICC